jgi:hypothetical protein
VERHGDQRWQETARAHSLGKMTSDGRVWGRKIEEVRAQNWAVMQQEQQQQQ